MCVCACVCCHVLEHEGGRFESIWELKLALVPTELPQNSEISQNFPLKKLKKKQTWGFRSSNSSPTSVKLLPVITITTTGKLLHLIGGQLAKYGTSKTPPGCLLFLKPSAAQAYVASCQGMPLKNPLKEAILPNAKAIELLHILSDKQPQRALFFFFFPSPRLRNHS